MKKDEAIHDNWEELWDTIGGFESTHLQMKSTWTISTQAKEPEA